jgi:putative membrane protein
MRIVMTVFYLLLILFGVSFAALNARAISLNLYLTTITLPVSMLMILMLGAGMLFGFILFLGRYWRLKAECHRIKGQLKLTEKEIKNLRAIPLHDQH